MVLPTSTPIFVLGNRTFSWEDVRTAAGFWGDRQRVERRVREGIASLRFLEADEKELEPEAVEAAAEDFRQEHNLIAAEEMSVWLEARGLEVEEWLAFIERSVARRICAADLDEIVASYPVEDEEILAAGDCEAICSGIMADTARKLAAAAVFAARRDTKEADIAELRVAFDELCSAALTPATLERTIIARTLEWTAVDCRLASFSDEDSAREAIFCMREEGLDLSDMARVVGAREERCRFFLEDLPPETQTPLLSAEKGALLGPIAYRGRPTLVIVVEKSQPTLGNPEVRSRAEKTVVDTAIERAARGARFLLDLSC
jgi:hypothetical protein